jgi:hypothetical protein
LDANFATKKTQSEKKKKLRDQNEKQNTTLAHVAL